MPDEQVQDVSRHPMVAIVSDPSIFELSSTKIRSNLMSVSDS